MIVAGSGFLRTEVRDHDTKPDYLQTQSPRLSPARQTEVVLGWLSLSADVRPSLILLRACRRFSVWWTMAGWSRPAFKPGTTVPDLDNVDIYPVLARLSGVPLLPNDGDDSLIHAALKRAR
jgi:hypothetical protein